MRYDWYQTKTALYLNIYEKNGDVNKIWVNVESNNLCIKIGEQTLDLKLYAPVVGTGYNYLVDGSKIEIVLQKQIQDMWPNLETGKVKISPGKTVDWDKVLEGESLEDESIDTFFRSVYRNASDDSKRAMNKSFFESSGTCLSTSWNQVKDGCVEVHPPEGTIARPFESS